MPSQQTNNRVAHFKHPSFTLKKHENKFVLSVSFASDFKGIVQELILHNPDSGDSLHIQKEIQGDTAVFETDYTELVSILSEQTEANAVTCSWGVSSVMEEDGPQDEEENETDVLTQEPIVLTVFEDVLLPDMNPAEWEGNTALFFVEGPDLTLKLTNRPTVSRRGLLTDNQLTDIVQNGQDLLIKGTVSSRLFLVSKLEANIERQDEGMYSLRNASFELVQSDKATHTYTYTYEIKVRCAHLAHQLFMQKAGDAVFTTYLLVHFSELDAPLSLTTGTPGGITRSSFSAEAVHTFGRMAYVFSPRFDESGKLQLCAALYDRETLTYARERAATIWLTRPLHSKKEVWLISADTPYERSFNSWEFFLYVREQEPEKDVYYVLDPASPDWEQAKATAGDHLLAYKSEAYIWNLLIASVLMTGGPAHHLYPFGTPGWDKYIRAKKVVLPNHLLGLSDERWTLNQHTTPWSIDLLLTSSKTEKRLAVDSFGLPESAVALTGLPQHSKLLEKANRRLEENILLVVPDTQNPEWRSRNEQMDDPFLSLARNAAFKQFAEAAELKPTIVLPHYRQEETVLFEAEGWTVLHTPNVHLLEVFLESSVLVTDSHPYTLDYGLLERPIFFYRPYANDSQSLNFHDEFASSVRAYHNELPGEIAEREEDLIYLLEQTAAHDFVMSRKNRKKADALLEHRDHQINERILEAVNRL